MAKAVRGVIAYNSTVLTPVDIIKSTAFNLGFHSAIYGLSWPANVSQVSPHDARMMALGRRLGYFAPEVTLVQRGRVTYAALRAYADCLRVPTNVPVAF